MKSSNNLATRSASRKATQVIECTFCKTFHKPLEEHLAMKELHAKLEIAIGHLQKIVEYDTPHEFKDGQHVPKRHQWMASIARIGLHELGVQVGSEKK